MEVYSVIPELFLLLVEREGVICCKAVCNGWIDCICELTIFIVVHKGDLPAVKELLSRGDNPNVRDNAGWTPLVIF